MQAEKQKKPFNQNVCIVLYGIETWCSNEKDKNVQKAL